MTTTRTYAVFLAGILLLAGCTTGPAPTITDPHGTATETSAEPEPDRAAEQDAIQAFKDVTTLNYQIAKDWYTNYGQLLDCTAGDFAGDFPGQLYSLSQEGAHQEGEAKLSGFRVIDHHVVDNTFHIYDDQLSFDVCTDNLDVDTFLPNGTSAAKPEARGRWIATITMWHKVDGDQWRIAGFLAGGGRPC